MGQGSKNRRGRFLSVAFFGSSLLPYISPNFGGNYNSTRSTAQRGDLSTREYNECLTQDA